MPKFSLNVALKKCSHTFYAGRFFNAENIDHARQVSREIINEIVVVELVGYGEKYGEEEDEPQTETKKLTFVE